MFFLHKLSKFTNNKQDLKKIYILQIRNKLEQSYIVWHSSITQKCEDNLERVQKSALKIILGEKYLNYENALKILDSKRCTNQNVDVTDFSSIEKNLKEAEAKYKKIDIFVNIYF